MIALLLGGNGIFGVVDYTGRPGAVLNGVKRLAQRAVKLGARPDYGVFGVAALGRLSRAIDTDQNRFPKTAISLPVVVSGQVSDQSATQCAVNPSNSSYDWLFDGLRLHGNRFLSELDGSFVLALWQQEEQRLVLMNDRCGDGKLFIKKESERLLFSSWLKLLSDGDDEVDRGAVQEFLRFLYITPPRTIYRRIECVEAGTVVSFCRGIRESTLLDPDPHHLTPAMLVPSSQEPLQEFQYLLERAIRRRIGTRRVGILLSSGVDSATLMAGCDQVNPGLVEAFTVGFDNVELDESNAARAMANCLHVPHATLRFNLPEYHAAFDKMAREFDQPFGDPSCLPLACAVRVARERVEIVCDGSGSDGLFGAPIPGHLRFALEFSKHLPGAARRALANLINSASFMKFNSYRALFDFDDPEELLVTWSGWKKREIEQMLGEPVSLEDTGFYRAFRSSKSARAQHRYDAVSKFPPDDGRFEAAAMVDLPMALPFHDAAVIAFISRQPQSLRYEGGVTKVLLRLLFARYYTDYNEILSKRYFTFPLQTFVAGDNYTLLQRYLSHECIIRHGLFDPERVTPWKDRYLAGDSSLLFKIWSLLILQSWFQAQSEDA